MAKYAIIGHPISHSLSPLMHNTAFAALGLRDSYEALDVEPEDLEARIAAIKADQYGGFNVTIPHKEAVMRLLDKVESDAGIVGAVNTVVSSEHELTGFNTDLHGFLRSIKGLESRFKEQEVLLLGAGGAARAVLYGLASVLQPPRVTILNRTIERAEALAADAASFGGKTQVVAEALFQEELKRIIDRNRIVINTTSVGMRPYVKATPLEDVKFQSDHLVIDLIYTPMETTLMTAAREAGATVLGGVEMFFQQGAKAFEMWTGREMPLEIVRKVVVEELGRR